MHGSPTVLIDGVDCFAEPDEPISVCCRAYRGERGISGAPAIDAVVAALTHQHAHTQVVMLSRRAGIGARLE